MEEQQHELEQREEAKNVAVPGAVWVGAAALAGHLVPINSLFDHPRNPNIGKTDEIAKSLLRFGQARAVTFTRALLVRDADQNPVRLVNEGMPLEDGETAAMVNVLVAGHHTRKAAVLLGWTHIAAIPHEFKSTAEASAYLVADNQLARLATQDKAEQLSVLGEVDDLTGTGYTLDDVETLQFEAGQTETISLGREPEYSEDPERAAERAATLARSNRMVERVLMVTEEQASQLDADIEILMKAYGLTSRVATMLKAAGEEASRVRSQ